MIAAVLTTAVLHLAQPDTNTCVQGSLVLSTGGVELGSSGQPVTGPVDRGSVVSFVVSTYNNGPDSFSGLELSVRIDSDHGVARLDRMTVESAEGAEEFHRLDRRPGPDSSFVAAIARFPLPVGISRTFQIRIHLDPTQPGSLSPSATLAVPGRDCLLRDGFALAVRSPETVAAAPNRSLPLLLGVATGAGGTLLAYRLRRQPARLARRARS